MSGHALVEPSSDGLIPTSSFVLPASCPDVLFVSEGAGRGVDMAASYQSPMGTWYKMNSNRFHLPPDSQVQNLQLDLPLFITYISSRLLL